MQKRYIVRITTRANIRKDRTKCEYDRKNKRTAPNIRIKGRKGVFV